MRKAHNMYRKQLFLRILRLAANPASNKRDTTSNEAARQEGYKAEQGSESRVQTDSIIKGVSSGIQFSDPPFYCSAWLNCIWKDPEGSSFLVNNSFKTNYLTPFINHSN